MSKTYGELTEGAINGTLTDDEAQELAEFKRSMSNFGREISLRFSEHIRSVDPYRRKDFWAAMIVAGRRRGVAVYDTPDFLAGMAKQISDDIDAGKVGFIQDLSELTGKADTENRQCSCLTALLDFYVNEERWPTKRELTDRAEKLFPALFLTADEKEWRRLRENLGIDWLENDKTRRKRGA